MKTSSRHSLMKETVEAMESFLDCIGGTGVIDANDEDTESRLLRIRVAISNLKKEFKGVDYKSSGKDL